MTKLPDEDALIQRFKTRGARVRLRKNGQVHTLDLSTCEPPANDALLQETGPLQSVEVLNCTGAELTDNCVDVLLSHRRLRLLTLSGTPVTPEAIRHLRHNLIDCRIVAT